MTPLVPCTDCSRHVRVTETRCPFCDGALPAAREPSELPQDRALTRVALVFMGASALAGCGKTEMPVAVYGPAPVAVDADAGPPATPDPSATPGPDPQAAPAYGAPPIAPTAPPPGKSP